MASRFVVVGLACVLVVALGGCRGTGEVATPLPTPTSTPTLAATVASATPVTTPAVTPTVAATEAPAATPVATASPTPPPTSTPAPSVATVASTPVSTPTSTPAPTATPALAPTIAPTASVPAGSVITEIRGFGYQYELTVAAGTTVTWINRDEVPHDVRAYDESWTSELMAQDESYSRRFDVPGRYAYFCTLHRYMQAVVIVE